MREIESGPTLTTREVVSKLKRTHGDIHYQFKQLSLVIKWGTTWPKSWSEQKMCGDNIHLLLSLHHTIVLTTGW